MPPWGLSKRASIPQDMSYTQLLYHIVFRTYRSERTIPESHERELYAYMLGIANNRDVKVYRIGGMPDHIHMLVGLPATLSVSRFMQDLKSITSPWLKSNPHFPDFDHWGKEYAAFTYSYKDKDTIVNYIKGQKEHHRVLSLADELKELIAESGITWDEKYFMKD